MYFIKKEGDFFISDWLRNRNTIEFLGIWEHLHNPDFNYGEFAAIRSQAGLNSYKISVKEWVQKTNAIGLRATAERLAKLNAIAISQMKLLTEDKRVTSMGNQLPHTKELDE